jgi:hypothetical protein
MIKEKNMYKPLPESLTIKQSGINGLGLFAQKGIAQGTNLGVTHLRWPCSITNNLFTELLLEDSLIIPIHRTW